MNLKKISLAVFLLIFISGSYLIIEFLSKVEAFNNDSDVLIKKDLTSIQNHVSSKKILIINTQKGFGGGEVYTLSLYKNLLKQGFNASILIAKNSWMENELNKASLPYFAARSFYFKFNSTLFDLCKKERIDLIHCNVAREVPVAKSVANTLPLKVVFTKHIPNSYDPSITKKLDGLIVVSRQIKNEMSEKNISQDLGIKKISLITPFFEEEKFINFKTNKIKNEFFFKTFSLTLKDLPVVTCIANMARDKNPFLLVKALALCVREKQKPFELIFAGDGRQLNRVKNLSKELGVSEYVHFLGHTRKIPSIINFSDIVVNASIREGFGISVLEACMMKKPIIVTDGTGTSDMVIHEKSGLLVRNDDAKDLANAIEKLINSPKLRAEFGFAAFERAQNKFSMKRILAKLEKFYTNVLLTKSNSAIHNL